MRLKKRYFELDTGVDDLRFFYECHLERASDVIDGDTIDVNIDVGFGITLRERVRLFGVDTPEKKTARGKEVLRIVRNLVWNASRRGRFFVRTFRKNLKNQNDLLAFSDDVKKGKFGRYLGEFFFETPSGKLWNLNEVIVKNNLGKPYFGGKKTSF